MDSTTIKEKFIVDAKYLPLMEKAENGCFESQVELCSIFGEGIGTKRNDEIADYFGQMVFENTDDNRVKLGVLWNKAIGYKDLGKFDLMENQFHTVINFMQENIPMEEWDFSLFAMMEEYTQLRI